MEKRMYAKCELAQIYLPNIETRSATNRLMAWIKRNTQLSEALREAGYYATQKYFTPRQVCLIVDFLGEP